LSENEYSAKNLLLSMEEYAKEYYENEIKKVNKKCEFSDDANYCNLDGECPFIGRNDVTC
jgi:hypothetical protein